MRQQIVSAAREVLVRVAHACRAGIRERQTRGSLFLYVGGALLTVAGCTYQTPAPVANSTDAPRVVPVLSAHGQELVDQSHVALVRVTLIGDIYLNGQPVTLEELKLGLVEYQESDGVVWYYRDDPELSPPRAAMEVMPILVNAGMPIKLASAADFSDAKSRDQLNLPGDEPAADGETVAEETKAADTEVVADEDRPAADEPAAVNESTTQEGQGGAGEEQTPTKEQTPDENPTDKEQPDENQTLNSGQAPTEDQATEAGQGTGGDTTPDDSQTPGKQPAEEAQP